MTKKQMIAQLKRHVSVLAKEREVMRKLYEEAKDLLNQSDNALLILNEAIDRISETL